MPLDTISNKLGLSLNNDSVINILSYTDGGNIKEININGNNFSGKKVRELLGLRSADFDISISDNNANITTRGYGHGVAQTVWQMLDMVIKIFYLIIIQEQHLLNKKT